MSAAAAAASAASESPKTLGILCGGGPAPGMNGVISACTLAARQNGWRVVGFLEGFRFLMEGSTDHHVVLDVDDVSRIHNKGGSILRTSRANPTKKKSDLENVAKVFSTLGINFLVTIGGDDTAFSSAAVARHIGAGLQVVHVPKTIDNDLPLPNHAPTFGFHTATEFGVNILRSLQEDSKTAPRWFIVEAMGRKAGHLALSMGKAAGAHLVLIPEEWKGRTVNFNDVCDLVWATILKRLVLGKPYGMVVLAEGLVEFMTEEALEQLAGGRQVDRDPHGHIRLDDFEFTRYVRDEMRRRTDEYNLDLRFTDKKVGYELRCADPVAFDVMYTRDLGNHAIQFLQSGGSGGMVTGETVMTFNDLKDPVTGKTRVRLVDTDSNTYKVARRYMTRLEKSDLENEEFMTKFGSFLKKSAAEAAAAFAELIALHDL